MMKPTLLWLVILVSFIFFAFTLFSQKAHAVTNDFCLTKCAVWDDGTKKCFPADGAHYGGFCSNGTFNPWCESGSEWKFRYPTCNEISFGCSYSDWNSEIGSCPGTTTCIWQTQSCSTADSCTSSQPYLNPGLCQPEKWDNIPTNAIQACQISPTIYKTCCNSNGTLDGNCNGGDYTGTCPSGTITVQCGFADKPSCGAAACATLAPPLPPPPPPPPPACSTPVCIPDTYQTTCTATACNGNYCSEEVSQCSSDGCRWDSLPPQCSNDYTYCGTCSAVSPPPPPPPPPPATCNYSPSCDTNGCSSNQRYVSGDGCPAWYSGPGCYVDNSCSGRGDGVPKPPPRVWTCLKLSKTYPTSPPGCDENIAKQQENQTPLTLLPGETAYAELSFKPIGQDLKAGAKAEIFFEEQGVSPSLKDVTRSCFNPKWETAGGNRIWLPDLTNPFAGGGITAGRGCRNPAGWDGINPDFPCMFANQSWNQDKAFDCSDGSKNQRTDSWGTIGGSSERIGADTARKSPQRYIQASVTCNGSICGEGDPYKADGSVYRVVIPIQVRSNLTSNTAVKFRAAVVDGWFVNPSGYLGPVVNPSLCGNFEANFSERTPQNGWGGGGGSPFIPAFQACDPFESFEKFTFFSNQVSLSAGPLPQPQNLTDRCPAPGNQATVGWDAVPGATYYNLRVDNTADGWDSSCRSGSGDFCVNNYTATSYSFTSTPGDSYSWWVHACNNSGCGSQAVDENGFKCAATPVPLTVSCLREPASPTVPVNTSVRWSANPSGTAPFTYDWSGTDSLSGNTIEVPKTYTTTGPKQASVTVKSADGQSQDGDCPDLTVNNNPLPWIYTDGDVHSNTRIYTPGGP